MWDALEAVQMKDYVLSLPGGLDAPVSEGGGNLSVSRLRKRATQAEAVSREIDRPVLLSAGFVAMCGFEKTLPVPLPKIISRVCLSPSFDHVFVSGVHLLLLLWVTRLDSGSCFASLGRCSNDLRSWSWTRLPPT